jgi:hypothetical protein
MKVAKTVIPQDRPSFNDWAAEFKVGILAPKPVNARAVEMMASYDWKPKSQKTTKIIQKPWYL